MGKNEGERKPELPRKVIRITYVLAREFYELVVRPTGLCEAEVIRSLFMQAIREQKRYLVVKSNDANGARP